MLPTLTVDRHFLSQIEELEPNAAKSRAKLFIW